MIDGELVMPKVAAAYGTVPVLSMAGTLIFGGASAPLNAEPEAISRCACNTSALISKRTSVRLPPLPSAAQSDYRVSSLVRCVLKTHAGNYKVNK